MARSARWCNLVALVALAFSIPRPPHQLASESTPRVSAELVAAPASAAGARTWSLRTDGWTIRVDGAEVEVPSLAQQTRPVIRPRGPQPLSPYDFLIAHHAEAEGLDWRLVAALIFEESRFDPEAVSDAGAVGLMQVRPVAAAAVGARAFSAPSDNIRTGARYLRQLSETFNAAAGRERLALVLAAYNMGPAHVRDAQLVARRVGYEPAVWRESMALVLPLLEQPQLCQRLPNGCAKGAATVTYVERILQRYDEYRRRYGMRLVDGDTDNDDDDGETADPVQAASANG